ncbi:hypothetical protein SLA2020_335980 [Shorea laevis]
MSPWKASAALLTRLQLQMALMVFFYADRFSDGLEKVMFRKREVFDGLENFGSLAHQLQMAHMVFFYADRFSDGLEKRC